jgi:hypothetical protein
MRDRPDVAVFLMAGIAVFVGLVSGITANLFGMPTDITLLLANFGFSLGCYLTTLGFRSLLRQPQFNDLLKNSGKHEVDISDLCNGTDPRKASVEKIWTNKPVSHWILIKAYAADTKAIFDKIVNNLLFTNFFLLAVSAAIALAWHPLTTAPSSASPSVSTPPGVAPSLVTLIATLIFVLMRVYVPIVETAQRNFNLLNEA